MDRYQKINQNIEAGYHQWHQNKSIEACVSWLEAWEAIYILLKETPMTLLELQNAYPWSEHWFNYVQELGQELHNAGLDHKEYFRKRIRYCEELLEQKEVPEAIYEETRIALAESYFQLGEIETAEKGYLRKRKKR